MTEGANGGPARFYRRRSLAELREAFQIATAQALFVLPDWPTAEAFAKNV